MPPCMDKFSMVVFGKKWVFVAQEKEKVKRNEGVRGFVQVRIKDKGFLVSACMGQKVFKRWMNASNNP